MPAPSFSPPRLRALREHRRLSREKLGARIGKTPGAIEQYERGLNRPSAEALGLLAHALDGTVADLFDEDPGDPRARYITAVCDLLPPMTEAEIDNFAAVVRARRSVSGGRPRSVVRVSPKKRSGPHREEGAASKTEVATAVNASVPDGGESGEDPGQLTPGRDEGRFPAGESAFAKRTQSLAASCPCRSPYRGDPS